MVWGPVVLDSERIPENERDCYLGAPGFQGPKPPGSLQTTQLSQGAWAERPPAGPVVMAKGFGFFFPSYSWKSSEPGNSMLIRQTPIDHPWAYASEQSS